MYRKGLILAALAFGLAGCANDSTSPNGSIVGNYSLRTINGSPLPYQFSNGQMITSDVLTLQSDGTFTEDVQMSDGSVIPLDGYWTENGNSITFTDRVSGGTSQGSISGSVLTEFFNGGTTEVFQRN